jgi:hypothetical protein
MSMTTGMDAARTGLWRTGVSLGAAGCGMVALLALSAAHPAGAGTLAEWAAALSLAVPAVTCAVLRRQHAGWFHPLSLPFAVVAVMCLGAPVWTDLTGRAAGLLCAPGCAGASSPLAAALSPRACTALVLVTAGYLTGAGISLAATHQSAPSRAVPDRARLRRAGSALMAVAAFAQIAGAVLDRGRAYGAGQLGYGWPSVLAPAASAAMLAGLIAATPVSPQGRVLRGREWAMLGCYLAAVAATGVRGTLIAPVVCLAWARSARGRPLRGRTVVLAAVVALAGAAVIAGYRADGSLSPGSPAAVAQGAAGDVSSPAWLTQKTVQALVSGPYEHGSTYLAAAEGQLPGPLSRATGAPQRTATTVFRNLIGFTDPDDGVSESYPSEAYLNFGLAGCLAAGLFLGALMGWVWRKHCKEPGRARDVLYPVLIAGLVYGFRSDALTQVKDVLYPMLVTWVVMARCRVRLPHRDGPVKLIPAAGAGVVTEGDRYL